MPIGGHASTIRILETSLVMRIFFGVQRSAANEIFCLLLKEFLSI